MDDAERWLYVNDPDYARASKDWKHVKTGTYVGPSQEIPVGGDTELDRLIQRGVATPIRPLEWLICDRPRCQMEYQPVTPWQLYCSDACKRAEEQRRYRQRRRAA